MNKTFFLAEEMYADDDYKSAFGFFIFVFKKKQLNKKHKNKK